ncbi:hypothetical protein L585_17660 [Pantoea ananatis BRT175]|nr:hypothetical protein L585_17660 [Pantoea ananatis BRT175]
MAPLTGIAFASNWLISKLNLNPLSVKTTRMTPKLNDVYTARVRQVKGYEMRH